MSSRLLLLCGIALCALGGAIAAIAAVSVDEAPRPRLVGHAMPAGFRASDFVLTDQDGRRVRLAETRGRVVVMTFLHSKCHSTCPVSVQTIRGALDDLEAGQRGDVDVFAISVSPKEDTVRNVRRFVTTQHASGFLRYLTGSPAELARVWKRYGIQPQGHGAEDHSAFIFLLDRRGVVRIGDPSHQVTPEDLAHDLGVLIGENATA